MRMAALSEAWRLPATLDSPPMLAAVVDGELEDAEVVLDGFDLHFEVPAVGELGHAEGGEGGAADGTEGSHVGVADALEEAEEDADEVGREDLAGEHGAGRAAAADAGADGEVGLVGQDRVDEAGQVVDDVGAVAVHVDEDVGGGEGGERAGEAGVAVAAGAGDDAGAGGGGDLRRWRRSSHCRRRCTRRSETRAWNGRRGRWIRLR